MEVAHGDQPRHGGASRGVRTALVGGEGHGQWLSVPHRFEDFDVVEAGGAPSSFHVRLVRPQEGWVLDCPAGLGR